MEYLDIVDAYGKQTGQVESRESCHKNGYWHKAVYILIFNSNNDILLGKRSKQKKLWPNKWDISVGGHVLTGEIGKEALIRECYEELGIKLNKENISYMSANLSTNIGNDIINNHFNECYITYANIDTSELVLQEDEVSEVRWWSKDEILKALENNPEIFADKVGPWENLKRYYAYLENKN